MLAVGAPQPEDWMEIQRMALELLPNESLGLVSATRRILVARDLNAQRVVGFVELEHKPGLEGHIGALAVTPDHQHQGLGRALLGLACDALRREGVRHVSLETSMSQERNRSFYRRMGFEPEGCATNDYADGGAAIKLGRVV